MDKEKEILELHKYLSDKKELIEKLEDGGVSDVNDLDEFIQLKNSGEGGTLFDDDDDTQAASQVASQVDAETNTDADDASFERYSNIIKESLKPIVKAIEDDREERAAFKEDLKNYKQGLDSNSKDLTENKLEKMLNDPSNNLDAIKNILRSGNESMAKGLPNMIKNFMETAKKDGKELSFEDAVKSMNKEFSTLKDTLLGSYKPPVQKEANATSNKQTSDDVSDGGQMSGDEDKISILDNKDPKQRFKGRDIMDKDIQQEIAREALSASGSDPNEVGMTEEADFG